MESLRRKASRTVHPRFLHTGVLMKTFVLHRHVDRSGISGTGVVAEGVIFSDGVCALRWLTKDPSTAVYSDIETLERIHGHNGDTDIIMRKTPIEDLVPNAKTVTTVNPDSIVYTKGNFNADS